MDRRRVIAYAPSRASADRAARKLHLEVEELVTPSPGTHSRLWPEAALLAAVTRCSDDLGLLLTDAPPAASALNLVQLELLAGSPDRILHWPVLPPQILGSWRLILGSEVGVDGLLAQWAAAGRSVRWMEKELERRAARGEGKGLASSTIHRRLQMMRGGR